MEYMNDVKDMNESIQRMNRLKERLDQRKRHKPGTFERYNHDVLNYLHHKFPEESESDILEAAAFISHRTAIVCQDMNAEIVDQWQKYYFDRLRKEKEHG